MYRIENIIYLAAPRTCSSSFAEMILDMGGERLSPHHTSPADKNGYKPAKDEICITTVRNPWDTLVSWYYKRHEHQELPFEQWLRKWLGNSKYVQGAKKGNRSLFKKYTKHCKHKLIFEDIQKEWDWVCRQYGLPETTIPHVNKSEERERRPWQELYTEELVRWVWHEFANEIHELQYYPTGF